MPRELGFTAAVNIDDTQGSILAARHLINLGHRDIAYVRTNRDVSLHFSVQQRFDSFMECCAGSGISPTVIVAQEGPDRIRRVLTDLMSLERMPTAIACQEDGIAVPLIFQLERSGYEVPERHLSDRLRQQFLRERHRSDHDCTGSDRDGEDGR